MSSVGRLVQVDLSPGLTKAQEMQTLAAYGRRLTALRLALGASWMAPRSARRGR